jgi:hypothetical protein
MAVELASAYVSIIPTTTGIKTNLEKELSPLTGVASKVGDDSGKALGSSFIGASGGLKAGVGEAGNSIDGFRNKAKSALSDVGISSGMLGVAGAAGLVAYGIKAVGAFTETAKAAIDMGAATGLSVEDASRWIALGDDYEISADTMTTSLGKIAKTLDTGKWSDYGIATRDAGGNARDTNDILLDTFDKLGGITNETDRAVAGNALFGKGYANLAPLIGKTRAEMEQYLGSVEKGQVITAGEAAKAEKMRLAQDNLSDAFGELTLSIGSMAASAAPALDIVAKGVTLVSKALGFLLDDTTANTEAIKDYKKAVADDQSLSTFITDIDTLAQKTGGTRSTFDKTRTTIGNFFSELSSGATGDADRDLRDLRKTIGDVGKDSPAAAQLIVTNLGLVADAAKNGDPAAQALVDKYGLTADVLTQLGTIAAPTATAAIDKVTGSLINSQNTAEGYSYSVQSTADTTARLAAETENAKGKADAFAASLQTAREKVDALYGAERSGIDAKYAFAESTRKANEDVATYIETLKKHKAGSDEVDTATRTASASILQASEDYATLNGASLNSAAGTDRQIAALTLQAAQLEPGSTLRANVEGYISDLKRIQEDIQTKITLGISIGQVTTAAGDTIGIRAIAGRWTPSAAGGLFKARPGGYNLNIAEAGRDEMVVPINADGSWDTRNLTSTSSTMTSVPNPTSTPLIGTFINNREDPTVATLNHILAMARLAS